MEVNLLIKKTIAYLKECVQIKHNDTQTAMQESATSLIDFIKTKLFAHNPKFIVIYEAYESNPADSDAKSKLELRLEDALEESVELQQELKHLLNDFEASKNMNTELVSKLDSLMDGMSQLQSEHPELQSQLNNIFNQVNLIKKNVGTSDIETPDELDTEKLVTTVSQKTEATKSEALDDNYILVPWDFSDIAECALQHAVNYSEVMGGKIGLLHIVKKEKEIAEAKAKLDKLSDQFRKKYKTVPTSIIREGTIFTTITEVSDELDAKLVIMGTHGIKGMQKWTGSWALKVIANSKPPFIVVQEMPKSNDLRTVLLPVDQRKENKQLINGVKMLNNHYDIKVILCVPAEFQNELIEKKTTTNLVFTRNYFKQNGINHEVVHVQGTKTTYDAIIKYSSTSKPDLILVLTTKDIGFQDYILAADEQKVIANESRIPVMCINPQGGGKYSYSSGTVG